MKHPTLINAIGDAVVDELKPLLAPLIETEFARQRAGGDPHATPALASPTRSRDRTRIRTRVLWSASEQLACLTLITEAVSGALCDAVANRVRDTIIAEKIADGSAQREFDAFVAETKRVPEAQRAARAQLAKLQDVEACVAAAGARRELQGLIALMRAKRERRERAV